MRHNISLTGWLPWKHTRFQTSPILKAFHLKFGGLNITDIETLIKASRLAWIGKLFSNGSLPWKAHLNHLLKDFGGEFLFSCNCDVEVCNIYSKFYHEFFQWWQILESYFQQSLLCLNT